MALDSTWLREFAERYTAAWCSQDPARVADHFESYGWLKINDGLPSVGRTAIAAAARSFMTSFPDLVVSLDQLIPKQGECAVYRWTLTGTNSGPGGSGHRVRISGAEEWTFSPEGLIAQSLGQFDQALLDQQLLRSWEAPIR